jgi:hypothetical protein
MSEQNDIDARVARRNYIILCSGALVVLVLIVAATIVML